MAIQPSGYLYEDEIDLRELILTLWRGKWVIALATLAAAMAALAISLALPKQYQAEADVALAQPKLQIKAPEEGLALQAAVPVDLKTAAAMAQAPEVFQRLTEDADIQAAWTQEEQPLTWQGVAKRAEVKEQGKSGLRLLFKDTNPQRAALVTNRWVMLVVERINEHYGWGALRAQLDPQVQAAWGAYQDAQAAYLQAVSENRGTALGAQLNRAKNDLSCVLALASQLERLQDNVAAFVDYLDSLDGEGALSPGEALSLATLQQRVLATKVCVADTTNLQTQWSADALSALTVKEAKALAQGLAEVIRQRSQALSAQQKDLETEVTRLEQALEAEKTRLKEARQRRDTAWQTYRSLDKLRSQGQVLTSSENQVALLAAQAVAPEEPVAPRVAMNVVLAGMMGTVLGVMSVWVMAWWQHEGEESSA